MFRLPRLYAYQRMLGASHGDMLFRELSLFRKKIQPTFLKSLPNWLGFVMPHLAVNNMTTRSAGNAEEAGYVDNQGPALAPRDLLPIGLSIA